MRDYNPAPRVKIRQGYEKDEGLLLCDKHRLTIIYMDALVLRPSVIDT